MKDSKGQLISSLVRGVVDMKLEWQKKVKFEFSPLVSVVPKQILSSVEIMI